MQIKNISSHAFRLIYLHHLHRLLVKLLDRLSDAMLDGLGRVISLNHFVGDINAFILLFGAHYLKTFDRMLRNFAFRLWRFLKEVPFTIDGVEVFSINFHRHDLLGVAVVLDAFSLSLIKVEVCYKG